MNVLVLAALTDATGNAVTARRIATHLAGSYRVTLVDAITASDRSLRVACIEQRIDVAIGVHAWFAGAPLRTLGVPYALVFGGTDLYEPVHQLLQAQMARAVDSAARLLAFSAENRARAERSWPAIAGRVRLVPQAVALPEIPRGVSLRARLGLAASDVMALLPTGIRSVKDPLHAVDALAAWHAVNPRVHLVIAGAILEPDYADRALAALRDRPGVHYVGVLPRAELCAAMREADVVLNTSASEGMCGTVLEAMALGTPVIARRNAGNASLVVHGRTGLLYDEPRELVGWIAALSRSPALREPIVRAARIQIAANHSLAAERRGYLDVVASLACERDRERARSAR
jgi:hypothetical protein